MFGRAAITLGIVPHSSQIQHYQLFPGRQTLTAYLCWSLKVRIHNPCSPPVNTAVILDTREHGPSRSAGAVVNDIIIILYLQDGCPK